ncbi:IclR family transcriptional regulator [Kushneria sinocarnis]|uniref:IclR family transcriptional regulator n=1 Tax=Kushneria sinocarnis TaxID=595502 RepID=A0A420WWD4_9GAMM|nr:IclR family transcriptional regulator C-terminal domain-containing protein [Kushneria sinocarnis]RKR03412.1 IclR family transcriptional regulator [Kushneria sinocarnis]
MVDGQEQGDDEDRITPQDRDFVTALASGLEVIAAFDEHHRSMTLSEVAARTGMNRARARRFLLTLHALGYVRRDQRRFELSPKVLSLGYAFLSANNYHSVIQQTLEEITEQTGESSSLGVLDELSVVYAARSAARHRLMAISLSVGTRLPAMYTSMGRVLLAELDDATLEQRLAGETLQAWTEHTITDFAELRETLTQVRRDGYCIVDQELDSGLRSLAVPLRSGSGRLLGAVNLSTNAARIDHATLEQRFLPILQEKCAFLSRHIS